MEGGIFWWLIWPIIVFNIGVLIGFNINRSTGRKKR